MSLTPGLHHAWPTCFSWKFQLAELAVEDGMIAGRKGCAHVRYSRVHMNVSLMDALHH